MSNTSMLNEFKSLNIFGNHTACAYIDESLDAIIDMKNVTNEHINNPTGIILSTSVMLLSIVSLVWGARLFRPVAAITCGVFGFYLVYKVSDNSNGISCESRIVISSFFALLFALITGCLIKIALFIIGVASFGSIIHLIFVAFPKLNDVVNVPQVIGKSVIYWGLMIISGILGGFFVRSKRDLALEIGTSAIGGAGFVYGLHGLTVTLDANVNDWVFLGIGIGSGIAGFLIQRKLRIRRKKKGKNHNKKKRKEFEKEHDRV